MPAYNFNPAEHNPSFGGSQDNCPVGDHPFEIVGSALKETNAGGGGYIAFTAEVFDGPAKGSVKVFRFNVHNENADTVRIAGDQLAALCVVTNSGPFQKTEELHGKRFAARIVKQANNDKYTDVAAIFDLNMRTAQDIITAGDYKPTSGGGGGGFSGFSGGGNSNNEEKPADGGGAGGWAGGGAKKEEGKPAWSGAAGADTGGGGKPAWGSKA